jgi:poly(A) polymerase
MPDAFVPVIKAKISGIPLNISMACLALSSIPDNLSLGDDNLLQNLNKKCVRSMDGKLFVARVHRGYLKSFRTSGER